MSSTNSKPGPDEIRVKAGYRDLVEALAGRSGVTLGSGRRGFGSDALLVNGHIFAMVSRGHLVLKLPRADRQPEGKVVPKSSDSELTG